MEVPDLKVVADKLQFEEYDNYETLPLAILILEEVPKNEQVLFDHFFWLKVNVPYIYPPNQRIKNLVDCLLT